MKTQFLSIQVRMTKKSLIRSSFLLSMSVFLILTQSCMKKPGQEMVLLDFESEFNTERVNPVDAGFELEEESGNHFLRVNTDDVFMDPGVVIHAPEGQVWNLEGFYQVKADITNTGDKFVQVKMQVGNDPVRRTRIHCTEYVNLDPGETKTVTVDLSWTPWVLEPQPEMVGMRGKPGIIKTDLSVIDQFTFSVRYPRSSYEFSIDNVRATGKVELRDTAGFFPFIDEFGQYIHDDWKGKIHSVDELIKSVDIEQEDLAEHPGPPDLNKYGGWTAGPRLKKTGFFHVEKLDGKWWMVDPEGCLFWSSGMNCVGSGGGTGIQYREHYFRNLPDKDSELGQFYWKGGWASHGFYMDKVPFEGYSFNRSNLYHKYGEDWSDKYRLLIHQRFKSWGVNTIGFASDRELAKQKKTAYAGTVWIRGTVRIEGSKAYWFKCHDVFDEGFREAVRRSIENSTGAGDPWCIGFYVDNELQWGELGSTAIDVLESPPTQPAKIRFVKDLKEKYRSIEALNNAWGTSHDSWAALLETTDSPDPDKAHLDLAEFYEKILDAYFGTVKEELIRVAPEQCYLGSRFGWSNNDVTVRTAAKYCDILSFNKYEYSVADLDLPSGVDKPVIIGEYHFGALDRGSFHVGLVKAKDQAERGECYQSYNQGALKNPYIVGTHWFQFTDEPTTGRGDGENFNVGFIDVCGNPFYDLIDKVRETNYQMYEYRLQNQAE
ncbi:beta-agarase [Bacteroidota bacterium]